jgi:hypothetical protein
MPPHAPLPGSPDRSCRPGLVIAIPPLADHSAAYVAAQMRRGDVVAAVLHERRLAQAERRPSVSTPVIRRARGAVGAWLIGLGCRLGGIPAADTASASAAAVPRLAPQ